MNAHDSTHDPHADEQASLWAARLADGSFSASDRAELDAWLDGQPERNSLLAHYRKLSGDLDEQLPVLVESGMVTMPAATPAPRRSWLPVWIGATALAAASAVAFGLWRAPNDRQIEHLAANAGQRQSFTLTDGTQVELNARTRLQVETSRGERHVRLTDGEAYFVVSKDPTRPFIVETPSGTVRVTGTTFDVRVDSSSELEVTVVEGSVQVNAGAVGGAHPSEPVALHANEQFRVNTKGVTRQLLGNEALEDALAWRRGQIACIGMPLSEVLARYARYHGRGITTSPGVNAAKLPVGGYQTLDDIETFLTGIEKAWPELRVTRGPGSAVQVSLRNEP